MTQASSAAPLKAENKLSKEPANTTSKPVTLSKQEKLLYSYIVACLLESGNLASNKAGVMALAKQAKASKDMLKKLVQKARTEHSDIDLTARAIKGIEAHKQSEKPFTDEIFERLLPTAKKAGKDEIWLSKKSGYIPSHSRTDTGTSKEKKSLFGRLKRSK